MKIQKNLKYNSDGHFNVENLMAMQFDQVLSCYLTVKMKTVQIKRNLGNIKCGEHILNLQHC